MVGSLRLFEDGVGLVATQDNVTVPNQAVDWKLRADFWTLTLWDSTRSLVVLDRHVALPASLLILEEAFGPGEVVVTMLEDGSKRVSAWLCRLPWAQFELDVTLADSAGRWPVQSGRVPTTTIPRRVLIGAPRDSAGAAVRCP